MNITEKLAQIKKLLFDAAAPQAPGPGSAKPYKLQDGTPVTVSALAPGGSVLINGSPAKAGDYVLEDGTQLTVDDSGKITAIVPAKAAAKAPAAKPAAPGDKPGTAPDGPDWTEDFKAVKQQVAGQQQAFEAYKADTDKKIAAHAAQMDQHHEALKQMYDVVQKIAKAPTGETPQVPKTKFSFSKVNDRKEMMNRYLHAMEEMKIK